MSLGIKEQIINIEFSKIPDVKIRVIDINDTIMEKQAKKKYPFELSNSIDICIMTNFRKFKFRIFKGYIWNGADIPRIFWRVIGSRTDNDFLIASMIHDYMLEFKIFILKEILKNKITKKEYCRLTGLIFGYLLKKQGTCALKANVMSWCVNLFQLSFNKKEWGKI